MRKSVRVCLKVANMKRFEYMIRPLYRSTFEPGSAREVGYLAHYGELGWELVQIIPNGDERLYYFKKQII